MLLVDAVHLQQHATGIQVVTARLLEILRQASLPYRTYPLRVRRRSKLAVLASHALGLPLSSFQAGVSAVLASGLPPPLALYLSRRPLLLFVHDLFLLDHPEWFSNFARMYYRPCLAFALRRSAVLITNSETTSQRIASRFPGREIIIVRPSIKQPAVTPAARSHAPLTGCLNFLSIGTIEPRKNLIYAAEVVQQVSLASGQPAILHLVGRPGWGSDWERLSRERHVILHGYASDSRIQDLLGKCCFLLALSADEGLGFAPLEMQAFAVPVACSDIDISRETVGRSAVLLPINSPSQAAAILLSAIKDDTLYSSLSASGLENVSRWNSLAHQDTTRFREVVSRFMLVAPSCGA
jgi:glycosyltransferase involved in cell wall biosynthesis